MEASNAIGLPGESYAREQYEKVLFHKRRTPIYLYRVPGYYHFRADLWARNIRDQNIPEPGYGYQIST